MHSIDFTLSLDHQRIDDRSKPKRLGKGGSILPLPLERHQPTVMTAFERLIPLNRIPIHYTFNPMLV